MILSAVQVLILALISSLELRLAFSLSQFELVQTLSIDPPAVLKDLMPLQAAFDTPTAPHETQKAPPLAPRSSPSVTCSHSQKLPDPAEHVPNHPYIW